MLESVFPIDVLFFKKIYLFLQRFVLYFKMTNNELKR